MMNRTIITILTLILLNGCSVTTPLLKKNLSLPYSYSSGASDTVQMHLKPWKIFYNDTCLISLLNVALQNNFSTRMALERIQIAMSDYNYASGAMLPQIGIAASGTVDKYGEYTMNGIGNDDTNRSETLPADKRLPNPYPEIFTGVTFSWEANVWGRLSSKRKATRLRYMASQEAAHATTTWLLGAVAEVYYELMGLDQERAVLIKNIALQQMAFEMSKIQKDGGKVNQLAVDQFEAQLLNTEARLIDMEQTIRSNEVELNRLLGRFPVSIKRDSIIQYSAISPVSTGNPVQLLTNRPDIRQSEYELSAAHADVDAARAAFYPALRLSASAGFSAFDFSKLFLTPGSAIYNVGAGLTAPLFQRKQLKALYSSANTRQRLALLNYEQTLVTAYSEVNTVSANDSNLARQIEVKQREVEVQRHAHESANDLFSVGFATYLEVINSQRKLLDAELEITELRMERLKNRALLYRALGGGWATL